MVEVVFNDSEKGALRCAQNCTAEIGAVSVLYPADTHLSQREKRRMLKEAKSRLEAERHMAKPPGGCSRDVLGLSFCLDMGAINCPEDGCARRELITRMFTADPFGEREDTAVQIERFWGGCLADRDVLMEKATAGEAVRIWYSDTPYSLCGFYHTLSLLRTCECTVTAVKLPRWLPLDENTTLSATSWGEIEPGRFACYLPLEREIPRQVRHAVATHWEQLRQENAPLRAVINGTLQSVGEDFYDAWIRMEIPDEPVQTAKLIGLVLGKHGLGIGDWLIAERIRWMLDTGELKLIQGGKAFYKTVLAKP